MDQAKRGGPHRPYRGGRHRRGGGNRHYSQRPAAPSQRNADQQADVAMADADGSNPALTIDIPQDTPRFADLAGRVHPVVLQTIADDLKFDHMTPVQAATVHELLARQSDMLAQAKTGTGKTVAFLLPAIQALLQRTSSAPGEHVSLLVISPTRELAMQIAAEAEALLRRLPQYRVCLSIGGTNKASEEKRIVRGCDILVGTPGRLYDHLAGGDARDGPSAVAARLQRLDTLVLDEADRLLDMGFLDSLKKIFRCLPDRQVVPRQGMLFSATIAKHVEQVAHLALAQDYKFISTIPPGEANTHERVPQHLVVVPAFSDMAAALVGSLQHELAQHQGGWANFKAIIFAPTAGLVDFYLHILQRIPVAGPPAKIPVHALHARMSQSRRTKTTDEYRKATCGILVATDVIARGMDFPGVSHVIQAGIPADKESYIHRLGRTARAGSEGRGTFIITEHEAYFAKYTLKEIQLHDTPADLR